MIDKKETFKKIINYVFQILLLLFLLTLLIQQFFPFKVSSTININWFILFVILFGVVSVIFPHKDEKKIKKPLIFLNFILVLVLSLVAGILIFLKLESLGRIDYIISTLGGLITGILSWLILAEQD